jgi:hypothetical protein
MSNSTPQIHKLEELEGLQGIIQFGSDVKRWVHLRPKDNQVIGSQWQ